jgi:hypothetical protein
MKAHGSVRIVKKWRDIYVNLVLRCLDDPKGLINEHLPSRHGPQVSEQANGLRLDTTVSSQDLSGAWVTILGREPARASTSP